MARVRTPIAKAKATGADVKNPQRHRARVAPKGVGGLGSASSWLKPFEVKAFDALRGQLPWLKESHRVLVEITATYLGRLLDPEDVLPLDSKQELRRCLAQLGATPADESKVTQPDANAEDPEEALFSRH